MAMFTVSIIAHRHLAPSLLCVSLYIWNFYSYTVRITRDLYNSFFKLYCFNYLYYIIIYNIYFMYIIYI